MSVLFVIVFGISVIQDLVYFDCLIYVVELYCMGVIIIVSGYIQVIQGGILYVVFVKVVDLCVGVVLFIVGLICEGEMVIDGVQYFNWGYECFVECLCGIGGEVMQFELMLVVDD